MLTKVHIENRKNQGEDQGRKRRNPDEETAEELDLPKGWHPAVPSLQPVVLLVAETRVIEALPPEVDQVLLGVLPVYRQEPVDLGRRIVPVYHCGDRTLVFSYSPLSVTALL